MITIGERCSIKDLIKALKHGGYDEKPVKITVKPIIVGHEFTDTECLVIEKIVKE